MCLTAISDALRDLREYENQRTAYWENVRKQYEAEFRVKPSEELRFIWLKSEDGLRSGAAYKILTERNVAWQGYPRVK